jgi:hypothetical protein
VKSVTSPSRSQAKHYALQPAEEQLASQCNERIQSACQIFEVGFTLLQLFTKVHLDVAKIKSALNIRQTLARMEQRIAQLIVNDRLHLEDQLDLVRLEP